MKTQFRDPRGILNSLQHISHEPEIFNCLLEAAESFDVCMIRRNPFVNAEQKILLLERATSPLSLMHLSRLALRRYLGKELLHKVEALELPLTLQHYLNYHF